ncbi:glutamine synthetase/guanido kinase [Rhizopus microsporus var. microsporus]|uniref:Glutamine synthetase n=1 Tax=Rhizopus microsporus var. microsporus TaxID=86635 RepID=A0A1X0R7X4_RHIZD|nr:glutamine synthetase/guanido kinase [Rhizopus microsporus var. microsporus]
MTKLTLDNIHQELESDIKVKVAAVDIDGVLRGKVMHKDKFLNIVKDGFGFCSVIFGWDISDKAYTTATEFAGEDASFFDLIAKVDLESYRRIPWEDNIPFFFVTLYHPHTNERLHCCPRSLLKDASEEYSKEWGITPYCGVEFEFYCFKETIENLTSKGYQSPTPLTLGMCGYSLLRPLENQEFYYNTFDWLKQFNVDIESWHTETGPGVFEAAVSYNKAVEMGDRGTLFKTSVKQIAKKYGIMASFMAKPYSDLPGCSGHMHFSLKNKEGENVFAVGEKSEKYPNMTKMMIWFVAGVLKALPSIMAILAPTINSYKRLVENFWAPVSVSWGFDSRHTAIRVIVPPSTSESASRIEMRVSGADINPHLALAAILKCGAWGIKTKQELPTGPSQSAKDVTHNERLARTLQEAIAAMEAKDSVARMVLGDSFVNHFVSTRKHEWNLWQVAVTDYELKRYMELV